MVFTIYSPSPHWESTEHEAVGRARQQTLLIYIDVDHPYFPL